MTQNIVKAFFCLEKDGSEKKIELPFLQSTVAGENAVDIRPIAKEFNMFCFDPGYMATASCKSTITYIDGNAGILMHRGHRIEAIAKQKTFLEVAYLLIFEIFPDKDQLKQFETQVVESMKFSVDNISKIIEDFPRDSHPMGILLALTARLSTIFCQTDYNILDPKIKKQTIDEHAILAIGKIAALVATINRHLKGIDIIAPRQDLGFIENFLYLMFSEKADEKYVPSKSVTAAIDKLFTLHADHEQNASTSAVRSVGSTGANMFASLAAGIAALWGPLHGGANEEVIKMIQQIGSVENIDSYIKKAETGEVKLMGFGHRIYKNNDPRAIVIKQYCDEVLAEVKNEELNKMLKIAQTIEQKALQEPYFIKRKLFPNVDFYSGIIYSAIQIPSAMFTSMFAVARTAGWVSQWKEMLLSEDFKISRPRQLYIGDTEQNL